MTTTPAQLESGPVASPPPSPPAKAVPKKTGCNVKLWVGLTVFVVVAAGLGLGLGLGLSASPGGMIRGHWKTNFGSYLTITDTHWLGVSSYGASTYTINHFTNSYVVMQNSAADSYNPSKFTKSEYHSTATGWAFCQSVYDGADAASTAAHDTSAIYDAADATKGCNNFPHTLVEPYVLPIVGSWKDNYGAEITITEDEYKTKSTYNGVTSESVYKILAFGANFLLMQNPADASYNPSKWTKQEFHMVGNDFGYCQSVYDGADAVTALEKDTTAVYLSANATHGCDGFPHSVASPA
jgi:hypothetical protein